MNKQELLAELKRLEALSRRDPEVAHGEADQALVAYVDDPEITEAFDAIWKWYA